MNRKQFLSTADKILLSPNDAYEKGRLEQAASDAAIIAREQGTVNNLTIENKQLNSKILRLEAEILGMKYKAVDHPVNIHEHDFSARADDFADAFSYFTPMLDDTKGPTQSTIKSDDKDICPFCVCAIKFESFGRIDACFTNEKDTFELQINKKQLGIIEGQKGIITNQQLIEILRSLNAPPKAKIKEDEPKPVIKEWNFIETDDGHLLSGEPIKGVRTVYQKDQPPEGRTDHDDYDPENYGR